MEIYFVSFKERGMPPSPAPLFPFPTGWNEEVQVDLLASYILDRMDGPIHCLGKQDRKHLELHYWCTLLTRGLLWEEEINIYLHAAMAKFCLSNSGYT